MNSTVPLRSMMGLVLLVLVASAQADSVPAEPISQGQRTFTVGNSFHWWVPGPLAAIAVDAGIKDHLHFGVSALGSSRVVQHWELPDDKNFAKKALQNDKIDVLTMCGMYPPDEGVEKFIRLGLEHNPDFRATLQEFWLPNDCYDPTLARQQRLEKNDHDAFSGAELRRQHATYFQGMDELVRGINQNVGRPVLLVVPAGQAVIRLREKIIAGHVPDFKSQADLFHDDAGHPFEPIQVLVSYCHFAVIYRRSPVGLPVPYLLKGTGNPKYDKEGQGFSTWWYARHPDPKTSGTVTPEDERLNRLLQELAWDTVIHHPLSGLYVGKSSEAEAQDAAASHKAWLEKLQAKSVPVNKRVVDAVAFNSVVEQVKDPATRGGLALVARQQVAKPGFMTTGTFSTFEYFGKYRVTYRLKCSDNQVKEDVCAIAAGGATRGEVATRTLKGTDFASPDQYQDFSVELLRGDSQPYFYTLAYLGHADVAADTISSERIADTTDRELIAAYGGEKPKPTPPERSERRMLWVQGLYQGVSQELDPFAAAIAELKLPCQKSTVDTVGRTVSDFPKDANGLSKYALVVLSNVNPRALGFVGRDMLKDWVEQGGTLIVTGGPNAFGKGQTQGTVLEELYPVQVRPDDLVAGGPFEAGAGALPMDCPPFDCQVGSCLMHQTTARPGARVLLECHGQPLLAYQPVGLGKVVVFTGTAVESDLKITPFWSDPSWARWSAQFLSAILR